MVHTKASKDDLAALLGSLMREVPNFPQPGVLFGTSHRSSLMPLRSERWWTR
jgi:hypothetical protein